MKKAQSDLIRFTSCLFRIINDSDSKILTEQFDKMCFIANKIVDEKPMTNDECSSYPPLWHKSIDDVSYYIEEISSVIRQNYVDIKLPQSEKDKLKKLIQISSGKVCTAEEEVMHIQLLHQKEATKKDSEQNSYRSEIENELGMLQEKLNSCEREVTVLLKCRELFQLWAKESPSKLELNRIKVLEGDNNVIDKIMENRKKT